MPFLKPTKSYQPHDWQFRSATTTDTFYNSFTGPGVTDARTKVYKLVKKKPSGSQIIRSKFLKFYFVLFEFK